MPISVGIRSLWITIRAMNYTKQAFNEVGDSTNKLKQKEKELEEQSFGMIRAGMMWVALSSMFVMGMQNIMRASSEGSMFMAKFDQKMSEIMGRLGTAITRVFGPLLDVISNILDVLSKNESLTTIIVILASMVTVLVAVAGAGMILNGVLRLMKSFGPIAKIFTAIDLACVKMGISFNFAMASIGILITAFTLLFSLKDYIGPWAAALVASIIAVTTAIIALKGIASMGGTLMHDVGILAAAVSIGAGAAAGTLAIGASVGAFDTGTRMVSKTGPAIVHAGEQITNPVRGLPVQNQLPTVTKIMMGSTIINNISNPTYESNGEESYNAQPNSRLFDMASKIASSPNKSNDAIKVITSPNKTIENTKIINNNTQTKSFEVGTRMVTRTGDVMAHAGEKIINPTRGLPVENQSKIGMTQTNTFDMRGTTIQTKVDKEELKPWILRIMRDAARSKET